MNGEATLLVDDRVPGVSAAMAADNQVRISGEQANDLALTLISPMAANNSRYRHMLNVSGF
jgi:hypothetical protein